MYNWRVLMYVCLLLGGVARADTCSKPVYLTFDTGHMGVAPLVAEVLRRHRVPVTFFAAQEKTQQGDGSLGEYWRPWWQARALEGHEFASHTWGHAYWLSDVKAADGAVQFRMRASGGGEPGQVQLWSELRYCQELDRASARLKLWSGRDPLPLFRAPGGRHSAALLKAAQACGYAHVGWSEAGFLGDELPSDRYPNAQLLKKALNSIRPGDILMAHLGIWSRQDPWAPEVLEPLIEGLQAKGICFASLQEHPAYRQWVRAHEWRGGRFERRKIQ